MTHDHFELFELIGVYEGRISPDHLMRKGLAHLRELCPECDARYEKFLQVKNRRQRQRAESRDYRPMLDKLSGGIQDLEQRLAEDRTRAARELRDLRPLTPEERRGRIENAISRYRTPPVAEGLMAEARELLTQHPLAALERLEEARRVALRFSPETYGATLCGEISARIEAHRANALRVAGELRGADALWLSLRAGLRHTPLEDPLVRAELDSLEASLRQDQRRFPQAAQLLARAEAAYRQAEDGTGVAKVLIQRATLHRLEGRAEEALTVLARAEQWTTPTDDPRLAYIVRHNRVLGLLQCERFAEAGRALAELEEVSPKRKSPEQEGRHAWLEGRISAGLRNYEAARKRLLEARNLYISRRLPYEVAVVSLDLAAVHLAEGRTLEVKRLARQTLDVFERQHLPTETAKALHLFARAAAGEELTAALLAELRGRLAGARRSASAAE